MARSLRRREPTEAEVSDYCDHVPQFTEASVRKVLQTILDASNNQAGKLDRFSFDYYINARENGGLGMGELKKTYSNFDEYVADYPDGESFRRWMTNDGHRTDLVILPATGIHRGIPGGFLWAAVTKFRDGTFGISVHDCDDGLIQKYPMTLDDAKAELENLASLVPFDMSDLRHFGYEWS